MNHMHERIAELRKRLGMTQKEFANMIGYSENYIWMLEKGSRVPSDRLITDIVRVFGANEYWLRTGETQMFPLKRNEQLGYDELFPNEHLDFRNRLYNAIIGLTPEQWETLEEILRKIVGENPVHHHWEKGGPDLEEDHVR